jgi:hypothetical protein
VKYERENRMASQWFCKVLGQEVGPVGFREMAEMVRAGTLKKDDPIRRKGSDQWTPAGEIIGLFRAAGKAAAETVPPEDDARAQPQQAATSADAAAPSAAKIPRPAKRRLLWIGGAALVVLSVAAGVWRWSSPRTPRFPEPRLGRPRRVEEEEDLDDSIAAFSDAMATFSKVVGGTKTPVTEEFSFTSSKDVRGIVVSYKCHSQSNTNYAENLVQITIRRKGEVIGESLDSYESQTNWGDVTKLGFWHSEEFGEITLKAGDLVDLAVTVKAGDYRNFVSEIKVSPLDEGASYPDDREFHGGATDPGNG